MANFTDPVKVAFGGFLHGFYRGVMADTAGVQSWAQRDFAKAAEWVPGRMVDAAEEMLAAWRKNDTSRADQPTPQLPVFLVAMARDFVPAASEFGRSNGDWTWVQIPGDPKKRTFQMRSVVADIRTQVLIAAADSPTATSLAMQFDAYCSSFEHRRFSAAYPLAGMSQNWPVQVEMPDILMPSIATEQKNLTMLVGDLTLRATVPMLKAPRASEPNDGKGAGANQDRPFAEGYDPSGYLVVTEAVGRSFGARRGSSAQGGWTVEARQ